MKLLFDQNLSPKLVTRLADLYPDSSHVQSAGLDCADDDQIWDHAKVNGFAVVTKDEDYNNLSVVRGSPPEFGCGIFTDSPPHHRRTPRRLHSLHGPDAPRPARGSRLLHDVLLVSGHSARRGRPCGSRVGLFRAVSRERQSRLRPRGHRPSYLRLPVQRLRAGRTPRPRAWRVADARRRRTPGLARIAAFHAGYARRPRAVRAG